MEAGEEIVDPFSQSFSPFWALLRPGDISRDREGECDRLGKKTQSGLQTLIVTITFAPDSTDNDYHSNCN